MFLDGVLIPASRLVNGSLHRAGSMPSSRVDYFHLELDTHDIILAEGAAVGNFRRRRQPRHVPQRRRDRLLYPNTPPTQARYCAPRVEQGFELESVRNRLALLFDVSKPLSRTSREREGPAPKGWEGEGAGHV